MYLFNFYFQSLDWFILFYVLGVFARLKISLPDGATDRLWIDHLFIFS